MSKQPNWPRIRDLPEEERAPFQKWLDGQTVPMIDGVPDKDHDAYYPNDYERWKSYIQGRLVIWD